MDRKYICRFFECTNERSMPFTSRYCDKHWNRNETTEELVDGLRHYYTYLGNSGECIDNDCEIMKESAEQIADRLEEYVEKIEKAKKALLEACHCRLDSFVDTSVGQEYEHCSACDTLRELEK